MKVFVAYSYHKNDSWVETQVLPLIEAFDGEVLHGKEIAGQNVVVGVQQTIQQADTFIGFRTVRDQSIADGHDGSGSHQWVTQELALAIGQNLTLVEIRETGVRPHVMHGGRVYIEYDPSRRDECLFKLVRLLATWRRLMPVQLKLLPQEFSNAIRPLVGRPGVRCRYKSLDGHTESPPVDTEIRRVNGGLFIFVRGVPLNGLIKVTVEANGQVWHSDFESLRYPSVNMTRDA